MHVFLFFAQTLIKGCVKMTLYKVYISVKSQQVYAYPDESQWEFEVTATRNEIKVFERLFYQLKNVQSRNFLRAHEPMSVKPYHVDGENDQYDRRLKKVYAWIHEFTSEESKRFIEQLPYFQRRMEVQL